MHRAMANVEAERALLGCALSDAESLYRVLPLLEAKHFSLDSNRRIYHVISDLANSGNWSATDNWRPWAVWNMWAA